MAVDVVIVNWNGGDELIRAVESALRFGGNVIVGDNDSAGGSIGQVAAMEPVTVIRHQKNLGFAAACDTGVAAGSGEFVFLLNPDATIESGTADDVPLAFAESGAMELGPRLEHTTGRPLQTLYAPMRSINLLDELLRLGALRRRLGLTARTTTLSGGTERSSWRWVVGSAVLMHRDDWERLGGMDPGYFLWFEDIDLGLRIAKAGGKAAMTERILVRHQGASTWPRLSRRRRQLIRLRGGIRFARQHLGWGTTLAVLVSAPLVVGIGAAQDVVVRLLGRN